MLLWATEDTGVSSPWPGYALATLCIVSGCLHGAAVCVLSSKDQERRAWATSDGHRRIEAPMPDSAV